MADIEVNGEAAYEADESAEESARQSIEDVAEIENVEEEEEAQEQEEQEVEDMQTSETTVEPIEDLYPLLDDTASNPEQQEMYKEYLDLLAAIDVQNQTLDTLKAEIRQICHKSCRTAQTTRHVTCLHVSLAQEQLKLETLSKRAIQLQNNGPARLYGDLNLATTLAEDELPMQLCFRPMVMTEQLCSEAASDASSGDSDS